MNKNIIDNNNIILQIFLYLYIINLILMKYKIIMGIGDWGLGIRDWGLGPIPNPQSPIPRAKFHIIDKKI